MEIPAVGYGIRYEYGIIRQVFVDGWQREQPDQWLQFGSPWEFPHPEMSVKVGFGGSTEQYVDAEGDHRTRWNPAESVIGTPYNYMVPGYHTRTVNTLRLWGRTARMSSARVAGRGRESAFAGAGTAPPPAATRTPEHPRHGCGYRGQPHRGEVPGEADGSAAPRPSLRRYRTG